MNELHLAAHELAYRHALCLGHMNCPAGHEGGKRWKNRCGALDDEVCRSGFYLQGTALSKNVSWGWGNQSGTVTSRPNSLGRKRGQTFSDVQMTEAARRVPISQASARVLP